MATNSLNAARRANKHFTIEFKTKVLTSLATHHGGNQSECARHYDVPPKYVNRWKRQRVAIFASHHQRTSFLVNNERLAGFWPDLERKLNAWIKEKRNAGGCVSGQDIKAKALQIHAIAHSQQEKDHLTCQSTRKRSLEPENIRPKEQTRSSTSGINVANPANAV